MVLTTKPAAASVGKPGSCIHQVWGCIVNLGRFVEAQEINAAAQQRRQLGQLPDVSQLEEEVLVHQQFVRAVRDKYSRSPQGELRQAGFVVEGCSSVGAQKIPTTAR